MSTFSYYDLQKDDLINAPEFKINSEGHLLFQDIDIMEVIKQYGTPLKITYLPRISEQIQKAKQMFNISMARHDYSGSYTYCYCTKSSHFSFVLREALKNDIHIETSSAYDIPIVRDLNKKKIFDKKRFIAVSYTHLRAHET